MAAAIARVTPYPELPELVITPGTNSSSLCHVMPRMPSTKVSPPQLRKTSAVPGLAESAAGLVTVVVAGAAVVVVGSAVLDVLCVLDALDVVDVLEESDVVEVLCLLDALEVLVVVLVVADDVEVLAVLVVDSLEVLDVDVVDDVLDSNSPVPSTPATVTPTVELKTAMPEIIGWLLTCPKVTTTGLSATTSISSARPTTPSVAAKTSRPVAT